MEKQLTQKEVLKMILITISQRDYYLQSCIEKGFEEEYINSLNNLYNNSLNELDILYNNYNNK